MSETELRAELRHLVRLLQDATDEYEDRLMAAGNKDLSNEWRWNLGELLSDAESIGEELALACAAAPEDIPVAMKSFLQKAVYTPQHSSRGHITRLKDVLDGRPPSWPEDTGQSPREVVEAFNKLFPESQGIELLAGDWRSLMWQFRHATDGYTYMLRAAGQGELADAWRDAVWRLIGESIAAAEDLVEVYASSPKQLPDAMRTFLNRILHTAGERCRPCTARLKTPSK